jgi:DNA-binding Lrp family transcriptional regulator
MMYNHCGFLALADLFEPLRRPEMAVKAYVLVVTDPGKTGHVVAEIRKLPNIVEMHEVMGPYDIVAEIEVATLQEIPPILGESIRAIEGIQSTTSLVTLPE